MKLSDLEDHELTAFIGLAKQVIRADNVVSDDEKSWLAATAEAIGADRWTWGIRAAQEQFDNADDVREAARACVREEAREAMHAALVGLAGTDEYIIEEAQILDWLAREWDIGDHVPMRKL